MDDKQLPDKDVEVLLLAMKSKWMYYCSGVNLGSAITMFMLDFIIGRLTAFSLGGVLMLMGALGFYQYSNHLSNKLRELIGNENKEI